MLKDDHARKASAFPAAEIYETERDFLKKMHAERKVWRSGLTFSDKITNLNEVSDVDMYSSDSTDGELSEGTRKRKIREKTKHIKPQKIDMEGMIRELDDRARMLVNGKIEYSNPQ